MIILVMGVSGSGKSTIRQLLADMLGWEFSDGDSFHSLANIEKMRRGIPLNDVDRLPWLQAIRCAMDNWLQVERNVVLACSALKSDYRHLLCVDSEQVKLVYLKGSFDLITQRLEQRQNHFMKIEMLKSQFDTLEEPKSGIQVELSKPPEEILQQIRLKLGI